MDNNQNIPTLLEIKAVNERKLRYSKCVFVGRTKCMFCSYEIDWWKTRSRKLIPMNAANLEPHWLGCSNAFRQPKPGENQGSRMIKNSRSSRAYAGLSRRR